MYIVVKKNVLLGSQSPRRSDLLRQMGIKFTTISPKHLEESYPNDILLDEIPIFLAKQKTDALSTSINKNDLLITADTLVFNDNAVLGKPKSKTEAMEMLKNLSGKKHTVITGVCLTTKEQQHLFSERTDVYFRSLDYNEIVQYIESNSAMDKAGSYGIQDWIGLIGVEKIVGCYYNVLGLPTSKLHFHLKQIN